MPALVEAEDYRIRRSQVLLKLPPLLHHPKDTILRRGGEGAGLGSLATLVEYPSRGYLIPNVPLDKFTVHYRGAASHYMDLAHVSSNSQDSQLLAMVLLENAQLTPDTLQSAKLQLVQQAQQRLSSSRRNDASSSWTPLIEQCKSLLALVESLPQMSSEAEPPGDSLPRVLATDLFDSLLSGLADVHSALEARDAAEKDSRPQPDD